MRINSIVAVPFFCASVLIFGLVTFAQTDQEVVARFERMLSTLDTANAELTQPGGSDLDLADFQLDELKKLRAETTQFMHDFAKLGVEGMNTEAGKAAILSKISEFENRLSNGVLLPHQNSVLRVKVLKKTIDRHGGNLAEAILSNHLDELKLTQDQVEKMAKLKEAAAKQIEDAKARFAKELEAITERTHLEFRKSLNDDQKRTLDKYLPLPQTKKTKDFGNGR
jgi:hypothetical protein